MKLTIRTGYTGQNSVLGHLAIMNNSNLQQLHILCLKMHEEGKTPSVGILRARAPFKVSVTEAIEAIKRFNANKPKLNVPSEEKETPQRNASLTSQNDALHTRIDVLEKEVAELKRALHKLINAT